MSAYRTKNQSLTEPQKKLSCTEEGDIAMNMKKMRGVVDPITLGFILAAAIAAMGEHNSATLQQARQENVQVQQASMSSQSPVAHVGYAVQKAAH